MGKIKKIYEKAGKKLYRIRNIERGTKGAWHIHFIINDIGTTASLIERAWPHGGVYITRIKKSKCPEDGFLVYMCMWPIYHQEKNIPLPEVLPF